jgi:hypothetical protein
MVRFMVLVLFLRLTVDVCFSQPRFPDVGPDALYQNSLAARSRLTILSISLRPGYEDLATLAFFRLGKGARVTSAYLTNGEAEESDLQGENPPRLAATRRLEASRAMSQIGCEARFLNMSDIAAALDPAAVRVKWNQDSLQLRLMTLISAVRPDIIILTRDRAFGGASLQWQILRSDLIRAIQHIEPSKSGQALDRLAPIAQWTVDKVWIDDGSGGGVQAPIDGTYPIWKKSYRAIGEEAAECYATLVQQRELWGQGSTDPVKVKKNISYRLAYPRVSKPPRSLDEGLPKAVPVRLRWIEHEIAAVTGATLKGDKDLRSGSEKSRRILTQLSVLMDSLDITLATSSSLPAKERRILLNWKLGLEYLRCSFLGVQVRYSVSDSIVTDRQITFLTVDTVNGVTAGGTTDILFAFAEQEWVVNESVQKRLPLQYGTPYRLLSPQHLVYNYPIAEEGLSRSVVWSPELFFIIHKGLKREENFVARVTLPLLFAPKFTVEVLTPIVRVVPSEELVVRLTNHSRDGVRDTLRVKDSLVVSTDSEFRLNRKDQSHLDTLRLEWKGVLQEGTYLFPMSIGGVEVGRFAARKFDAQVDTSKRVGLVTGLLSSPAADALRRFSMRWDRLDPRKDFADRLTSYDVILIDRRALTLVKSLQGYRSVFDSFVERGGHLVILSQDAPVWNGSPLVDGMHLTSSPDLDERTAVTIDSTSHMATTPNELGNDTWSDWLNARAYNIVSGEALARASVLLWSTRGKHPLIATWQRGQGRITYCDLALNYQLLNLHQGGYRILANLLSY